MGCVYYSSIKGTFPEKSMYKYSKVLKFTKATWKRLNFTIQIFGGFFKTF